MGVWNTFVEGDNLAVLATLDAGSVDLVYIDPPYNTGSSFAYADAFPSHAAWVAMMRPRLVAAREVLASTGAIFVSIDDHEVAHLRLLMDDVFGEANLLATVVVNLNAKGRQLGKGFATSHEYLLVYARDAKDLRARRDVDVDGRPRPTSRSSPTTAGGSATCRCATPTRSSTPRRQAPCTSRSTATRRPARSAPRRSRAPRRSGRCSATAARRSGAGRGRSSTSGPTTSSAARSPAAPARGSTCSSATGCIPSIVRGAAARSCAPSGSPRRSAPPTPPSRS